MISVNKNILLISIVLFLTISCNKSNTNKEDRAFDLRDTISVEEFYEMKDQPNTVILDVRTPEEYNEAHVQNSLNINFHDSLNFKSNIEKLDKNKTYLIYCRTDRRSGITFNLMKENNFKRFYILKGGFLALKENNKTLSTDTIR